MSPPSLSLLVLRTSQLAATRSFYEALGLIFAEEKHGSGPTHYSTQLGSTVLEIYPGEVAPPLNRKSSGAIMVGVRVETVDKVIARMQEVGVQIVTPPRDSPWGRRAVILDPDGRAVEISQQPAPKA